MSADVFKALCEQNNADVVVLDELNGMSQLLLKYLRDRIEIEGGTEALEYLEKIIHLLIQDAHNHVGEKTEHEGIRRKAFHELLVLEQQAETMQLLLAQLREQAGLDIANSVGERDQLERTLLAVLIAVKSLEDNANASAEEMLIGQMLRLSDIDHHNRIPDMFRITPRDPAKKDHGLYAKELRKMKIASAMEYVMRRDGCSSKPASKKLAGPIKLDNKTIWSAWNDILYKTKGTDAPMLKPYPIVNDVMLDCLVKRINKEI